MWVLSSWVCIENLRKSLKIQRKRLDKTFKVKVYWLSFKSQPSEKIITVLRKILVSMGHIQKRLRKSAAQMTPLSHFSRSCIFLEAIKAKIGKVVPTPKASERESVCVTGTKTVSAQESWSRKQGTLDLWNQPQRPKRSRAYAQINSRRWYLVRTLLSIRK